MKKLQKLSIIALGVGSLVACNGGGGSSGGSTPPNPNPTPTSTPSSTLQPLVFTQDTLNIDKVGQHRIWHLTVKNPNPYSVIIHGNLPDAEGVASRYDIFEIDPNTPVGPSNVIDYAIGGGGENNCIDALAGQNYISTLKAGQSCTYTFDAMWAMNAESTTQFSFKLRYLLSEENNPNNYGLVQENCSQQSTYQCLNGTNNPITYTLLNVSQKVDVNPATSDSFAPSGDYMWHQTASSTQRHPITYNANTNTLNIGSQNYSNVNGGDGVVTNYSGTMAYAGPLIFGSTVSDYYMPLPEQNNGYGMDWTIVGWNGGVYSARPSSMVGDIQYVYPLDQTTNTISFNTKLPDPVKFQGKNGGPYVINQNGSIYGLNYYSGPEGTGMAYGCFVNNGAGYNNYTLVETNGLSDLFGGLIKPNGDDYVGGLKSGYYTYAMNYGANFHSTVGGGQKDLRVVSLLDFNTCQLSTDNFLVASNYIGGGDIGSYIPNAKFILLFKMLGQDVYILPASLMSNGLNGQ